MRDFEEGDDDHNQPSGGAASAPRLSVTQASVLRDLFTRGADRQPIRTTHPGSVLAGLRDMGFIETLSGLRGEIRVRLTPAGRAIMPQALKVLAGSVELAR